MSKRRPALTLFPLLSIALLLSATDGQAETPLGRLFLTAQQRTQLDQLRQRDPSFWQHDTGEAEIGLTLNGEVRSSSGRRTRWINGEADWDNRKPMPNVPVGHTYYPEDKQNDKLQPLGNILIHTPR